MRPLLSAALARAQQFLLEPATPREASFGSGTTERTDAHSSEPGSFETAVLGLTARSGVSTVARGLVATLRVPGLRAGRLVVIGAPPPVSGSEPARYMGTVAVPAELDVPEEVARYCDTVVKPVTSPALATVWDVGAGECERAAAVCARADAVVLVAARSSEPALADVVSLMLAERFGRVLVAANRVPEGGRWAGRAAVCLPQSRIGALLAARGRKPGGAFGAALEQLAVQVSERVGQ